MQSEVYTPGPSNKSISFMEHRSLASHASFLRPHLRRGMKILDCGCGQGTITLGIAQTVTPGKVWGIDDGVEEINQATKLAAKENIPIAYQLGSVYQIPFEENFFDGVFAHALMECLSKPLNALQEMYRVLKPGGFMALRSADWGGCVLEPWNVRIAQAMDAYLSLQSESGGDIHAGRKLAGCLRKVGVKNVETSASYEIYPETTAIAEHIASKLEQNGEQNSAKAFREWALHPDAMFAHAWFEAVGTKLL